MIHHIANHATRINALERDVALLRDVVNQLANTDPRDHNYPPGCWWCGMVAEHDSGEWVLVHDEECLWTRAEHALRYTI